MKTHFAIILLAATFTFISCSKDEEKETTSDEKISLTTVKSSNSDFFNIKNNSSGATSDPFEILEVSFEDGLIKITVGYSGGCETHHFTLTWDEMMRSSNPPIMHLILTHDANNDFCDAYITETLYFPLENILDSIMITNVSINAYSGYNPSDSVIWTGDGYDFDFEESYNCNFVVTAQSVICGNGLYDNLWFAVDDSVYAGYGNYHFHKYLQPVAIDDAISEFIPVEGKQYIIGVIVKEEHKYLYEPVCLAYVGPSVPVKILCIEEY
ncbi:hypothetical protein [Natronoflexus pectinivorans]|uniref:Uncharacterized protein n=1 Tax=Natronoflexus pectinivorans TaxID=682526 RepID=A0A4R2GMI9_9BACT|nr:hypothetical protein [Natronoflexus pectinivorans]TCO10492.1 hypothetical protein EV194_101122 [Natronoflexus pectinivorans]